MNSLRKNQYYSYQQLDEGLYQFQLKALKNGMIPIVSAITRPVEDDMHLLLGFGHNELALGVAGIHGETAAIRSMGRIESGYANLVATSSLSPCPFCQATLATHLGIKTIRILDDNSYKPDKSSYQKLGITPQVLPNPSIEQTFSNWLKNPENSSLWKRDIGIPTGPGGRPHQFSELEIERLLDLAVLVAKEGEKSGEIPIGALVIDEYGVVIGSGAPAILSNNDPSSVASMVAWRAAGSRDDWGRCTLLLTHGPDSIAYAMFNVFGFGQLIVGSDKLYPGAIDLVRALNRPVIVNSKDQDQLDLPLQKWLQQNSTNLAKEFLGANFSSS